MSEVTVYDRLHHAIVHSEMSPVLAPGRAPKSTAEHLQIVSAIVARDRTGAESAMRTHLSHVVDVLTEVDRSVQLIDI